MIDCNFKKTLIVIQASNINESIQNRLWLPIIRDEGAVSFLISRLIGSEFRNIVIATSELKEDDVFVSFAKKKGVGLTRGSFYDVPGRLITVADKVGANNFIRINATNPLVDIDKMKELVKEHIKGGYDYSFNEHRKGVVWGTGCDVFRTDFLKALMNRELTRNQRETIGQFIRQNSEDYKVLEYEYTGKRPRYKLSMDTKRDYEVICEIANNLDDYKLEAIIGFLDAHPLVANFNREEPATETGTEKLFFNPEKVENILHRRLPDMLYPISVELTLTNRCNLKCVYCSDMDLRKRQGVNEQLDINTLKALFDDLSAGGTKGIVLEGGGEPTMYSRFEEVVEYARKKGLAVGLITNGTKSMEKELLEQFEWIRISLDASTSKEYMDLKGVDFFERVINNISEYTKYCHTVGVGYVVTKNNISQIEPLIIRLKELGVSYVQCRPVVDNPELFPEGVDLSYLKYYENSQIAVTVDGMTENAQSGNNGLPCYAHSITSIISGDGSVYICGRLNIYDWLKPIGNIRKQSFRRIWYSEERQNQAEMLVDGEFCKKNCPQCRISKFNQMFSRLDHIQSIHFI